LYSNLNQTETEIGRYPDIRGLLAIHSNTPLYMHKFGNLDPYYFLHSNSEHARLDISLTYDKPYTQGVHDVIINGTTKKASGI